LCPVFPTDMLFLPCDIARSVGEAKAVGVGYGYPRLTRTVLLPWSPGRPVLRRGLVSHGLVGPLLRVML